MKRFQVFRLLRGIAFFGFLIFAAVWLIVDPNMPPETHFMGAIMAVLLTFMMFTAIRQELRRIRSPF